MTGFMRGGMSFSRVRRPSRRCAGGGYRRSSNWHFERLETLAMLSSDLWTGATGDGLWTTSGNWSDGVPTATSNVSINGNGTVNLPVGSYSIATLSLGSGARISFALDGTRAGIDYAVLDVAGNATLDGTLVATLAAGYSSGPYDNYQPLLFASRSATVPTSTLPLGEAGVINATSFVVWPTGSHGVGVTNTADSGTGSLRNAIDLANASGNPVEQIYFAIPESDPGYNASTGVWTISPATPLPAITEHVLIDATQQQRYAGSPVIQLVGNGAGAGADGLDLTGGHSRVSGLDIRGFGGDAIHLSGTGFDALTADYLGTDTTGTLALANGANGVELTGVTNNMIGSVLPGEGNVISGNGANGVDLVGSGTSGNLLVGNFIGTNPGGTVAVANGGNGLQIINGATNNTIGGVVTGAANVISGNGSHSTSDSAYGGVFISGSGTSGNLLEGNFIGTNSGGTSVVNNFGNGVAIQDGVTNNVIGGTAPGAGNIISGNGSYSTSNSVYGGVVISGSGTSGNMLEGNFIGTDAGGASVLNNFGNGVDIQGGAANNTIGGTASSAGNVISGNGYNGVNIGGSGTSGNLLEGNFIGTNAGGTAALANGGNGLQIVNAATNNTVGGTVPGAANVISGNGSHSTGNSAYGGVFISGSGTSGNLLEGNFIGTDAGGTTVLENFANGVAIQDGATNETIGGTTAGAANVISGNRYSGVYIGGSGTSGNRLEGNFIGTNFGGDAALANGGNGVEIDGANNNAVGGNAAGSANTIAFNNNDGVLVDTGTQNLISQNSIVSNAHLGIELTNNGNNSQAAPVLTALTSSGSTTTVTGSLTSAANTSFEIEFFANAVAGISAVGEGQTFLGAKSITTDASGAAAFTVTLPVNLPVNEQLVTATATDPNQDTSAFSNGVALTASPFHLTDDIYIIGSGTISVPAGSGVLANDTGPSQLRVTSTTVAGAEGGIFNFNADGSFTYTPPTNFPGFDYARYTAQDASGGQGMATVDVLSQTGGVVWKFYEQVLHRDPDYAGLQGWLNDFSSGGKPGDIALGFFESTELLNQIITGYYEQYLDRAPQGNDLTGWEAVWRQTGGPEGIKAGFADSPEFYASNGATPASWLTALYEKILERTPDQAGYDGWLKYYQQQLAAGVDAGTIRYQIALGFFASPEAYDNDVTGWFYEYLDRAPTLAEQAQYANQMTAGANDRTIEQDITNLPEYSNNPPASPSGTAAPLPNYLPANSAAKIQDSVVATDAVFAGVR